MIGPWINNETQRLVVGFGEERREGPHLDVAMLFLAAFLLILVFTAGTVFLLPIAEKYSNLYASASTCGWLAALCFILQREYRPEGRQFGLSLGLIRSAGTLVWIGVGLALTGAELGLVLGPDYLFTARLHRPNLVGRHGFELLLTVVVGPVLEELLTRGYLYLVLRQNWGRRCAALISSAIFAVMHPTTPLLPVIIFIASLTYVYLNNKARSLTPSIVAHCSYNAALYVLTFRFT